MPMPIPITAINRLTGLLPARPSASAPDEHAQAQVLDTVQKKAEPITEKRASTDQKKANVSDKFSDGVSLGYVLYLDSMESNR